MGTWLLRRLAICVALVLVQPQPATSQAVLADEAGTVRGTIEGRFQGAVDRVPFAAVQALTGTTRRSTVADSLGRYTLRGLPAGEARLTVTSAGYETLSLMVLVPAGDSVTVDLELRAAPVPLPQVEVSGGPPLTAPVPAEGASTAEIPELELRALDLGPGLGQAGLVDVIAALPGNDPSDPTDVLFMRGSTTDLKLVLLDGVPVYTPFHVAGLLRSFEPAVLGGADLHVGGAPARFDGGLSHILDLRTRKARRDRLRLSGSVDLISASGAVETPLGGDAGVIVTARRLHDVADGALGGATPYGYQDALIAADATLGGGHELRATGFWNAESVVLDPNRAPEDAHWANRAGSIAYGLDLGRVELDFTAGLSGYRAELPLQPTRLPGAPPPPALLASAETDRGRIVGEARWGPAAAPIRVGLSVERISAGFAAASLDHGDRVVSRGSTSTMGAFVDAVRPLVPGVTLRAGLRADYFSGDATRLAPRASLTWELGPEALLTVAAGRYHQPTRTPDVEVERTLAEVASGGVSPAELLPIATSDHFVLSLDQRLADRVRLGLEGFWKGYDDLPTTAGETVRSSGLDVRVVAGGDGGAAWLGYGLSWFWSTVDLSGRASEFAGRHLLSAGTAGDIGGPFRGEARISYGAGLPYTSIPFGSESGAVALGSDQGSTGGPTPRGRPEDSPLAGGLDEAFLRLDLEVHAVLEPNWGGRPWRVRPYLRLLNALDRRDALFYTFQPWRSESVAPLAERPVLPLLGVAVSF